MMREPKNQRTNNFEHFDDPTCDAAKCFLFGVHLQVKLKYLLFICLLETEEKREKKTYLTTTTTMANNRLLAMALLNKVHGIVLDHFLHFFLFISFSVFSLLYCILVVFWCETTHFQQFSPINFFRKLPLTCRHNCRGNWERGTTFYRNFISSKCFPL